MIDYMVLGVIAALALLAWQIIRAQRKQGGGCGGCGGSDGPTTPARPVIRRRKTSESPDYRCLVGHRAGDQPEAGVRRGYELILVARRRDRLEALSRELTVKCRIIEADLSDAEQCKMLYCRARSEDLEIVVNNAGFGMCGSFAATSLDRDLEMIRTNIVAVHILTKLFLHDFRLKNRGYILNVASSAGFMAGPLMATYYATKSYVLRLTEAIREELRREGSAVPGSGTLSGTGQDRV